MAAAAATSLHPTTAFSFPRFPKALIDSPSLHAILSEKTETSSDPFFIDGEKEWLVKSSSSPSADSFQRARLAEQLRLSRSADRPATGDSSGEALSLIASRVATALQPILDPEIEKDVPPNCILGAAANGSFVTLFTLLLVGKLAIVNALVASLSMAVLAAYLSITRGTVGDFVREVGRYTMTVADSVTGMIEEYDAGIKIDKASRAMETLSRVEIATGVAGSGVEDVLDQADRAVKEVRRAESELEAKQQELEAAALRRKQALVEAAAKLEEVARAKAGARRDDTQETERVSPETTISLEVSVYPILFHSTI